MSIYSDILVYYIGNKCLFILYYILNTTEIVCIVYTKDINDPKNNIK